MQPLASIHQIMTWMCMCPADETATSSQKMAYVAHALAIFIISLICFITSLVYYLKFISIDFNGAIFAFMSVVAACGFSYFLIAAIVMRHQIANIFVGLSAIYSSNENDVTFRYLERANDTSEWFVTLYLKYIVFSLSSLVTTSLLSMIYCYLARGDLNVDHFYRPGKYALPWDQTTTTGYFGEIGVTILIAYSILITTGMLLVLFVSICIHHQAFYKMFKHSIEQSEQCNEKFLCRLIHFHMSAKDWFLYSANVYSSFALVPLISGTIMTAASVFLFDLQWRHIDFTVASVILTSSLGMSNLFHYCYFGKLATESYEMMSDCIYNMDWHERPNRLKKYFILMITNMQKPIYYQGFGVATLELGTFLKLLRTIFSYYMALKTVASK